MGRSDVNPRRWRRIQNILFELFISCRPRWRKSMKCSQLMRLTYFWICKICWFRSLQIEKIRWYCSIWLFQSSSDKSEWEMIFMIWGGLRFPYLQMSFLAMYRLRIFFHSFDYLLRRPEFYQKILQEQVLLRTRTIQFEIVRNLSYPPERKQSSVEYILLGRAPTIWSATEWMLGFVNLLENHRNTPQGGATDLRTCTHGCLCLATAVILFRCYLHLLKML